MRKFSTSDGQEWSIELLVGTLTRIKGESSGRFDLWHPMNGTPSLSDVLWEDYEAFFDLLAAMLSGQWKERGITAEQFGLALPPEQLVNAQFAFFEEWKDFFLQLQRPKIAAALEKEITYRKKLVELVTAKLADPRLQAIDGKMTAKMESILNKSFGSLLDSLESTLAVSPGDS